MPRGAPGIRWLDIGTGEGSGSTVLHPAFLDQGMGWMKGTSQRTFIAEFFDLGSYMCIEQGAVKDRASN
jgi:hypothetical protein